MERKTEEREPRCLVCGGTAGDSRLCERCRESLLLCDVENYAARKIALKNTRAAAQTLSNTADL